MTVREIIILGCQQEEMTQSDLAEALNYSSNSTISIPLSRHDGMGMRVETLIKWLEAVGGELYVQFPDHDSEYILDGESEGVDYPSNTRMILD